MQCIIYLTKNVILTFSIRLLFSYTFILIHARKKTWWKSIFNIFWNKSLSEVI